MCLLCTVKKYPKLDITVQGLVYSSVCGFGWLSMYIPDATNEGSEWPTQWQLLASRPAGVKCTPHCGDTTADE